MTEENKKEKCKCCLGLGIIILILGIVFGVTGSGGFGVLHAFAIAVGAVLIAWGMKKTSACKCCAK
ncbi:MAG TPA: hypothetical protein PKV41_02195 [Candidatus Omnitrophota bacterium]|nr:hypothetical protein [Candidatus Omnitrophota bacterium]